MDPVQAVRYILELAPPRGPLQKKDIALGLGVSAGQIGRWEKALGERGEIVLNVSTRNAIASVLEPSEDDRLEGMRRMVEHFESAIRDGRAALEARTLIREHLMHATEGASDGHAALRVAENVEPYEAQDESRRAPEA